MKKIIRTKLWNRFLILAVIVIIAAAIALNRGILCTARFKELAVIDRRVPNKEKILDNLPGSTRVLLLKNDEDALEALTRILARKKDIKSIRLFSHGSPGQVYLNGEVIDHKALKTRRKEIRGWAESLDEGADILLYGCDVARGKEGKAFVDEIAMLTGADVAASVNPTGGPRDEWALEYASGDIEAESIFIEGYLFYLANQVVENNNDSGAGSLRNAITEVGNGEKITFNLGSGSETITLTSGELAIAKNLTIDGDNAEGSGVDIVIDGHDTCRGFNINSGTTVELSKLTVQNCKTADKGGGIYNAGTLALANCTISGNSVNVDNGSSYGGGIYNKGSLTIEGSTISGNTAQSIDGEYSYGGGIFNDGSLDIVSSTISGNSATSNSAYSFGGGIFTTDSVTIKNCTISGNRSEGSPSSYGAGIYSMGGTLAIRNSILANNNDNKDYQGNGDDTLYDYGYNVIGGSLYEGHGSWNGTGTWRDNDGDGNFTENSTSKTGTLSLATTLADNGGPTMTLALGTESFAAASADSGIPPADNWNSSPIIDGQYTDQRGVVRMDSQNTSIGAYSENYISAYYYRSKANGDWSNSEIWEQSTDESTWVSASSAPDETSLGTTIKSQVTVNSAVTTVDILVSSGAVLTINSGKTLTTSGDFTLNDGAAFSNSGELIFSGDDSHVDDMRNIKISLGKIKVD